MRKCNKMYLVTVRTITNKSKFSHVWSSTTVRAASYPYYNRFIVRWPKEHKRLYLERFGLTIGVHSLPDWYRVRTADFMKDSIAYRILQIHNGSIVKLITEVFDDHPWDTASFKSSLRHTSSNFRKDKMKQRELLDKIGLSLGYKVMDDWYKVSQDINHILMIR